jgi:methyl-accepting chemotaxis protein
MSGKTENVGVAGRLLVHVGALSMRLERAFPSALRGNFGARIFWLAFVSLVGAPALAAVLFDDVLLAVAFVSGIIAVTGFLGYCEMYRALRAINANVRRIQDGEFDVAFETTRRDEIGETYTALENTADSLAETLAEAERAEVEAREAQ